MQTEVVVIGGGVSGLTAAALLAGDGRDVTLIEQAPHLAPLIRRYRREGFWCNAGFHYVGGLSAPGGMRMIWRLLGLPVDWQLDAMSPDGFDRLIIDGAEAPVAIPQGFDAVADALAEQFPSSSQAAVNYVRCVQATYCTAPFIGKGTRPDWFRPDEQALCDVLRADGAEPGLIDLLCAHGTMLHGVRPAEVPFFLQALVLGSYYESAHTLRRGGDAIAEGLERAVEKSGVHVLLATAAEAILTDDRRLMRGVVVRSGSDATETIECKQLISTIHPRRLLAMMPPGSVRPVRRNNMEEGADTYSASMVHFAADAIPEELRSSNLYFTHHQGGALSGGGAILCCGPAAEQNALTVMMKEWSNDEALDQERDAKRALCRRVVEAGGRSHLNSSDAALYDEWKERIARRAEDVLCVHYPALRGRCRVLDVATPATFERWTATPDGSIYGRAHTSEGRNPGYRGPLGNMQQAGQSIGLPGVVGACISGAVAAGNLTGWDTMWKRIDSVWE